MFRLFLVAVFKDQWYKKDIYMFIYLYIYIKCLRHIYIYTCVRVCVEQTLNLFLNKW